MPCASDQEPFFKFKPKNNWQVLLFLIAIMTAIELANFAVGWLFTLK